LLRIFLVKKEKKYGSSSACCSSKFSKFIVLASSLGGVPVFNLPILKSYFSSCSLKPVEGFSLNLPAGVLSSPICIKPFKKVPVVRIIFDALISYLIVLKIRLCHYF
jgi:hypothetical protein